MKRFVGRAHELERLTAEAEHVRRTGIGRFVWLRGRRRVGKSRLVQEFCTVSGLRYCFFQAPARPREDALAEFVEAVEESSLSAAEAFEGASYASWSAALRAAVQGATREQPALLVVDELPYLVEHDREVVLHMSAPSFDAATFEIWGALINGARLVVGPAGTPSAIELGALLRDHGVTTAFFTTGLFHLLVDECIDDLSGLRQIVAGGDVLSPSRARRLLQALPGCRLVNGYGPTEVTTFTTCHVVDPLQDEGFAVPIGRPINKTWIRLLDEDLEPVADGTPGYLYAGGDGLARGYVGDCALTAERFIPDPWSHGQRLYFTGDLARTLPDGTLEFLGRADQQIKRRGFRVEPAEIEESLRHDPRVRDAAVVGEGDTADERVLVAYLAPESAGADASELISAVKTGLRDRLPEYLIPDRWDVLDALPLNTNGKVDRRALAAASAARAQTVETADAVAEPRGEVESVLAAIWRELFKHQSIGRHDDFFELGGHSLLASRMVSRVRDALAVEVPLVVIFDHPTVAQMAELIERA